MAIGDSLGPVEAGWKRFDDTDPNIIYTGTWNVGVNAEVFYGGTNKWTTTNGAKLSFTFYGTKLRFWADRNTTSATNAIVYIDGIAYTVNFRNNPATPPVLLLEVTGLPLGYHTVSLSHTFSSGSNTIAFDCIDIDEDGYLSMIRNQLTSPQAGWRRYDDSDSRLLYEGTWDRITNDSNNHNSTLVYSNVVGSTVMFKFYGTKIRLIAVINTVDGDSVPINIDGVQEYYNQNNSTAVGKVVVYEKIGLPLGVHTVVIGVQAGKNTNFDAIDIDEDGRLLHPFLTEKYNIEDMEIGDCIPCKYQASSGVAGTFSELGTCNMDSIPFSGTATPNGLFYFIKVDKGLLVADRVVQHSISWNNLNTQGFVEGKAFYGLDRPSAVAIYGFENTGSNIVLDKKGNYNGVIGGSIPPEFISTPFGGGMKFNGNGNVTFSNQVIPIGKKSIKFKFKKDAPPIDREKVITAGANSGHHGLLIYFDPIGYPSAPFIIASGKGTSGSWRFVFTLSNNICDGRWHDILITWDGTTNTNGAKVYIDGSLVAQTKASITETTPASTNLTIGSNPPEYMTDPQYFTGELANIAIYNDVITPVLCDNDCVIRLLSGGVAHANNEEKTEYSLSNKGFGAYPDNEWDKYIVNSDLDGKITPGDNNNIWHWSTVGTWCRETPVTGTTRAIDSVTGANNYRTLRSIEVNGNVSNLKNYSFGGPSGSGSGAIYGFRPVLQLIESKQKTLWY